MYCGFKGSLAPSKPKWLKNKYPGHVTMKTRKREGPEPVGHLAWTSFGQRTSCLWVRGWKQAGGRKEWIPPSDNERMAQMTFNTHMPPSVPIPYTTLLTPDQSIGRTKRSELWRPRGQSPTGEPASLSIPVSSPPKIWTTQDSTTKTKGLDLPG